MTSDPIFSTQSLVQAGQWFLRSGIQETSGGVARYHYIEERRNARVSTEITGYAVSALLELESRSGDSEYRAAAEAAGVLLCHAWNESCSAMPFEWSADGELPEHRTFFFDNGIIARALIRLWKPTSEARYLETALRCGEAMRRDFVNARDIHPILELPSKQPAPRDSRWSRSSDCYQLKSALAWLELSEVTGDASFVAEFERALARSLETQASFFDHEPDNARVMDRLHAYSYFLEALLARADRPEIQQALEEGIARAAGHLRRVRGEFERSDVNGQLLRVRLWADDCGAVTLDEEAATQEAEWAAAYQMANGGFNFGRRAGKPSNFSNPVSTSFCLQALALWDDHLQGRALPSWRTLI